MAVKFELEVSNICPITISVCHDRFTREIYSVTKKKDVDLTRCVYIHTLQHTHILLCVEVGGFSARVFLCFCFLFCGRINDGVLTV